ncbi:MAG: ATP-dependent protease subunit HslV [bacterium]|jgi:ATP-dependent HslUV protease subunit HslV
MQTVEFDGAPAPRVRSTTILAVRSGGKVAVGGDGQVTLGQSVLKHGANKIRVLSKGGVISGFAGAVADALTLFERFEGQLEKHPSSLKRAAVELAKEWRTDKYLRRLEALLIAATPSELLIISGNGDVIEPDDNIAAVGSGADIARASAKALMLAGWTEPRKIVEAALGIAAEICIYTNDHITIEEAGG